MKFSSITAAVLAAALVVSAACTNPGSPADPTVTPTGPHLGFEAGYDVTKVYALDGDVAEGSSMGAAFALDSALADTGSQSLAITGTSQKNRWSDDFFVEAIVPTGLASGLAIEEKSFTAAVYVPADSKVTRVSLTLLTEAGVQTMPHGQALTAGQWNQVTFPCTAQAADYDYFDAPGPNLTGITQLRLRFQTTVGDAPASAPVSVHLDSVNW